MIETLNKLTEIMDGVVDKVPQQVGITLPKLKKTTKATPPPIPNLPKLKKLTNDAFKKDIFGAPTFVVNKKIFWGQDRLDYALDECDS